MTVADTQTKPVGGGAHRGRPATTDPAELLADPAVEAVLIAAPARFHADLSWPPPRPARR
ncbi:MAG TPA: hypothetical protein VFJ69_11490 [Actinomycetota bacterium]|jgi:predicted dehydrogenase|nr:hypothetical protein [Actinomycetota bacterium]